MIPEIAGTALFALLAMAGDLGGAFGPGLVGTVTQQAGDNLQSGMLVGSVFPLILILSLLLLKRQAGTAADREQKKCC